MLKRIMQWHLQKSCYFHLPNFPRKQLTVGTIIFISGYCSNRGCKSINFSSLINQLAKLKYKYNDQDNWIQVWTLKVESRPVTHLAQVRKIIFFLRFFYLASRLSYLPCNHQLQFVRLPYRERKFWPLTKWKNQTLENNWPPSKCWKVNLR
jgi:hypothetical protein